MIDIFIYQTARGPAWQMAEGYFTLRASGKDGTAKYTSRKLVRDKTTAKIITAELMVNAIYVMNIYTSKRGIQTREAIRVHLDNTEAAVMLDKRLKEWKEAGWKNKKGEDLPMQYRLCFDTMKKSKRTYIFTKGEE